MACTVYEWSSEWVRPSERVANMNEAQAEGQGGNDGNQLLVMFEEIWPMKLGCEVCLSLARPNWFLCFHVPHFSSPYPSNEDYESKGKKR